MSKLAAENIWWPDASVPNSTIVVEGSNEHKRYTADGWYPSSEHLYTLKQTARRIIWACACGRTLSREKELRG